MKRLTTTLICLGMIQLSTAAIRTYDFEVSEGYETGALLEQNSWQTLNAIPDQPTVDDVAPSLRAQHVRIVNDPKVKTGLSGALSPALGPQPYNKSPSVSVDLYFSDLDGAAYDVLAQSISQNLITWRVRFTNSGEFLVFDSVGGTNGYVDTGVQFPLGSYFKLYVETITATNEINYYFDGVLIYSSEAGVVFGQSIEQVVFICNNNQANEDEFFLFDNLIIDTENVDLIFSDSFEQLD